MFSRSEFVLSTYCLILFISNILGNAMAEDDRSKLDLVRNNNEDEDIDEIVGGTSVPRGQHKYMAYLKMYKTGWGTGTCGATVLGNAHILTAAHCVHNGPYDLIEVYMRIYSISMDTNIIYRSVTTENIRINGNYNRFRATDDIAILKLTYPLTAYEMSLIATTTLPPKGSNESYAGNKTTAVGWGLTSSIVGGFNQPADTMQQVNLDVQTSEQCQSFWGTAYDNSVHICTYTPNKSVCGGDSGGPIISRGVQIGISSFVAPNEFGGAACEKGRGVFTRVSKYVNNGWIAANMF